MGRWAFDPVAYPWPLQAVAATFPVRRPRPQPGAPHDHLDATQSVQFPQFSVDTT